MQTTYCLVILSLFERQCVGVYNGGLTFNDSVTIFFFTSIFVYTHMRQRLYFGGLEMITLLNISHFNLNSVIESTRPYRWV
uniref:Uncharacterized protein n=1 Tax=Picea sitchensis TaxID=3332 RepID=B8LNE9_PICSI|nr:unknown [Picea sitchensis]